MSVDKVNGRMAMGATVRGHKGYVIVAQSMTKLGSLETVAAEALAARHVA